jgi:protein involved in polysaccharide export with SLBB domain
VSILGEVNRPGRYPVRPGSSIASLLLAADGLTLRANEREIHLLSGEKTRRATLEAPVEDGDVIFVASLDRVYVVGEGVRQSGPVSIPPNGLNALQAIAEAGWFAPDTGRGEVEILRESEGRTLRIPVPVDEILAGERDPSEFPLLPADTLRVSASWW